MKRWVWLVAVPWIVTISTGIPESHFVDDMPQTKLIYRDIIFTVYYSTAPDVVDALKDEAEALNAAHERRTKK